MKITIKFLALSLMISALFLTSCSKDGEVGPIGPSGIEGQDGQDGTDGQDGEDGNANVIYSDWIEVQSTDWDGDSTPLLGYAINAPELTSEIEDTGTILGYHRWGGNTRSLPHTYAGTSGLFIGYYYTPSTINLEAYYLDNGPLSLISMEFRYVLIPGGTPATAKGGEDYSKMSYEEITTYFRIEP